ncbi:hypothetical protein HERIO_2754 [Hepatospora eriocheir]|uniref:Uncharacterized protein n=1 Tax=Hepatospora eriocheir TaxID=1081669 RepID=A0A1X0QCS4_9MICR|nr:hypothetical protein HERIO_2754 [Hepatospora eriocheir]
MLRVLVIRLKSVMRLLVIRLMSMMRLLVIQEMIRLIMRRELEFRKYWKNLLTMLIRDHSQLLLRELSHSKIH